MKGLIRDIKIRLKIIWANTKYTAHEELAYTANNWGNIASTIAYTLSYVAFIDIIFNNTTNIAGYTQDEMLFFMLVSQFWFYFIWTLLYPNIDSLIRSINSGHLDLILTKPMPHLFYLNLKRIKIVSSIRDSSVPIVAMLMIINWSNINISTTDFIVGVIIFCYGIICTNTVMILGALPSIWIGESSSILGILIEAQQDLGQRFPYEGWSIGLQKVFTFILPIVIASGITSAVMLNKLDEVEGLIAATIAAIIFTIIRELSWKYSIKHYTSASS